MVMYPEIREYQKNKSKMSYSEKIDNADKVIQEFQEKGSIPGAYRPIWSYYEKRLKLFHKRQMAKQEAGRSRNDG